MKNKTIKILSYFFLIIFVSSLSLSQISDPTKSTLFDLGKMWTFDYPPMKYFSKTYNFTPTEGWFEKARLSCVRFATYCSASFISEDGLIMTNHHCARASLDAVNRPGEKLGDVGFYAPSQAEERKVPGLFVDQLILIEDVTREVQQSFESGTNDEDKINRRAKTIQEIEKKYSDQTSLVCNVISFYNGGRYSLYGYKRYNDVRLVFAVETIIGFYGGDYDNFTYPRYNLDLSFFRVYDETRKPLKPKYYFKWNLEGAKEGEAVFILGTPGATTRLFTVSQLEFIRDHGYATTLSVLQNTINNFTRYIEKHPDQKLNFQTQLFTASNSFKAINGAVVGLKDPSIMLRKKDFEKNFKNAIMNSPTLKAKYANVWEEIDRYQKEKSDLYDLITAFNFNTKGRYFALANRIFNFAKEMKKPESERREAYKGSSIDSVRKAIARVNFNKEIDLPTLEFYINFLKTIENKDNEIKKFLNSQSPDKLALNLIENTILVDNEKVKNLLNGDVNNILNSTDPFLSFIIKTSKKAKEVYEKWNEINSKESAKVQLLGNAIFEVYGTEIPPDATGTLRIADGVVKGYEYNGTLAPAVTTFYGFYDRYYSFKKPDWDIPDRWKNPPSSFNLSTPLNFAFTSDVIGGNSGSPVINTDQKVVGLVHDINIEALSGNFIYLEDKNRAVAVHSSGILEALNEIYKADRIVKEIKTGKMTE